MFNFCNIFDLLTSRTQNSMVTPSFKPDFHIFHIFTRFSYIEQLRKIKEISSTSFYCIIHLLKENYEKEKQMFNAEAKCLLILMLKSTSEQTLPEVATRAKSRLLFP